MKDCITDDVQGAPSNLLMNYATGIKVSVPLPQRKYLIQNSFLC